jgi:hypothetical protein
MQISLLQVGLRTGQVEYTAVQVVSVLRQEGQVHGRQDTRVLYFPCRFQDEHRTGAFTQ